METDGKIVKKTWEKDNIDIPWEEVKKMYVTTDKTYKQVAEHFGLKYNTVRLRGVKGKWLIEKYHNIGEEPPKKKKSELTKTDAKMKKKTLGAESKYRSDIHDPLIYQLTKDNKTLHEIAEKYLLIGYQTIFAWMKANESFERAYKAGLEEKLDKVEQNIYERSAGIRYTETVTTVITGKDGEEEKREVKTYDRYSLPDVGAAKLILTTQRRDKWAENIKNDADENREIKIVISEAKEPAIEEDDDNGN